MYSPPSPPCVLTQGNVRGMSVPRQHAFATMRALQPLEKPGDLDLASLSSSARLRETLAWAAVLALPLAALLVLGIFPALNLEFENHWFHFQIVSFVSLIALVLGVTTIVLLNTLDDTRAFFILLALGAIAGIFLLHGLATPNVLEMSHADHAAMVSVFANPILVVTWSAPLSLFVGAVFFALASWTWSARVKQWLSHHRRAILLACAVLYLLYAFAAFLFPLPFEWLAQLAPTARYIIAGTAMLLYGASAWRFWKAYRTTRLGLDAGLAFAAALLAEALVPILFLPLWSIGWWSYHILMLLAFCLALGAVVVEYERARHFELIPYFTAVSIIVTALLALVAGEVFTRLFADSVPANALNNIRWGATLIFILMAALLFSASWLVVRRGDMLLRANNIRLQQQQVALERGRLVETLVPIGAAMGVSLELDRVLDLICRESHALFQVDTALIWYKQGDDLIPRAVYGTDGDSFLGMRQPLRNNPLLGARVVREERPIYVNHAMVSSGVSQSIVQEFGIQSILGVPLYSEKQVVGALVLMDRQNPERFGALDLDVAQLFAQQAAQALTHSRLYEKIQQQTRALTQALSEIRSSYSQTLAALSAALDARDRETEGHSRRVTTYALLLADVLNIQDTATREAIEWGALLHDVGKIGVPDAILHKPAALSEQEWVLMRQHPEIGYQILQSIPFLRPAFAIVRHHHERWDGSGYPMGLRQQDIPLAARIFALADTLDAITTDRPYRAAQSFQSAFDEIMRQREHQFDPQIVDAFVTIDKAQWQAAAT